jgi:N-methylhydantoinase B
MDHLDPVSLDIWWSRVTSIVDEMAAAVQRTAFSAVVREANDYCCTLLDSRGDLIAQNTRAIPSFIGTVSNTVREFLKVFPAETLVADDVIITNDPWIASGHLPDLTMALPIFVKNKLVGFCGLVFHLPDIGGRGGAADTRDFYEEGLKVPVVKLCRAGVMDPLITTIIKSNVRIPDQVMGDIEAAITAAKTGEARVMQFMAEYGLGDLDNLSKAVQEVSERAMRKAIDKLPDGSYVHEVTGDGWDLPLNIHTNVIVDGDTIKVDYDGTSAQSGYGINSVFNYTYAYTLYALKSAICPAVPNNEGTCRPFEIVVPEGSCLNPTFPAPVSARFLSGHFIQAAVFGSLAQAVPEMVNAENSAPFWGLLVHGKRDDGSIYVAPNLLYNGGQGANLTSDGISCLCIPSNVGSAPIETIETTTGLMVIEKEFIADSGGAGMRRGGLGQKVILESVSEYPTRVFLLTDRIKNPAKGYDDGSDGQAGAIFLNDVPIDEPKGEVVLHKGDQITLILPGGGGYGSPDGRGTDKIAQDIKNELVSSEAARKDYGFNIEDSSN